MLKNRLVRMVIFTLSLFLIISLIRSIWSLLQKENIVIEEEKRLAEIRRKNQELKSKLTDLEGKTFIEKQAREKLGLGKEGDFVVLLPSITPVVEPSPTPVLENWQKWVKLYIR